MTDAVETVKVVGESAQTALVNLIVVLADTKYFFGRRLSEWIIGAPSLEAGVACAGIAAEEMGNARVLYPLLEQVPTRRRPVGLEREGDRRRHYCPAYLDEPLPTWSHAVAALILIDSAMNVVLEAVAGSGYAPLARRAARILDEERFHRTYAEGRLRELVASKAGAGALEAPLHRLLPEMLMWFGPEGEPGIVELHRERLLDGDNEQLRQRWLGYVVPLFEEAGVEVGLRRVADRWAYQDLPWPHWNALQRRLEAAEGGS